MRKVLDVDWLSWTLFSVFSYVSLRLAMEFGLDLVQSVVVIGLGMIAALFFAKRGSNV